MIDNNHVGVPIKKDHLTTIGFDLLYEEGARRASLRDEEAQAVEQIAQGRSIVDEIRHDESSGRHGRAGMRCPRAMC